MKAFISGSAVGIGRAIAVAVGERGGHAFGLDLDADNNAETARQVEAAGGTFTAFTGDAGDMAVVRACFDDVAKATDALDLLVNNTAIFNNNALNGGDFETQGNAFRAAIDSCLMGAYYCTHAALPLLKAATAPNIINMLTDHVKPGFYLTGLPATGYDCAKFGLWRLTENWAVELKKDGIRVNGLCFGATDTPMLRAVSVATAEIGMKASDIADAVFNVVEQGPDGDTGESYLFGLTRAPLSESRAQIVQLREGGQPTLPSGQT